MKDYAENVITKNMLSQVEDKVYSVTLVDSILDYRRDNSAVYKAAKYVVTRRVKRWLRNTTQGSKPIFAWKDSSETWITLRDIKESNTVNVAEFDKANIIDDEPYFS